ncbi:MAG: hypothetical protein WCH43_08405 [Verrucomicrobiota bacterium]
MKTLTAFLVMICTAVLVSLPLAFWAGGLTAIIAWSSLSAGALAGAWAWWRTPGDEGKTPGPGPFGWLAVIAFTLFSLRAFCWLVFFDGNSIKFISSNNLGDLSLHLTYIREMANGVAFWPDDPILHGIKLHYPVGTDLLNSLLTLAGLDIYRGLVLAGLLFCAASGFALWRWGGGFALAGFLFNGGLAGFAVFKTGQFADFQDAVAWKSIPLALFVTQRGLLYAIPAGLLLLISWRARFFVDPNKPSRKLPAAIEVLLYASMPLFHLHTFLFLSFLLGSWLVLGGKAERKQAATLISLSLVPATILVGLVSGFGESRSIIHLHPGWVRENQGFLAFWFVNFGVLPLFVVALCVSLSLRIRTQMPAAAFVFPSVAIFLLSCIVMFAPWEWDNTKLMVWCYLAILPFLWECLIAPLNFWIRIVCCLALFFSGFVSLLGGLDASHDGYELAQRRELKSVEEAVKTLPVNARFASAPGYNHPLLLNGRKIAVGYAGHLWSHGVANYEEEESRLKSLMLGNPDWRQIATDMNVRYIFWGPREDSDFPQSKQPWTTEGRLISHTPWFDIYDLQKFPVIPSGTQ